MDQKLYERILFPKKGACEYPLYLRVMIIGRRRRYLALHAVELGWFSIFTVVDHLKV